MNRLHRQVLAYSGWALTRGVALAAIASLAIVSSASASVASMKDNPEVEFASQERSPVVKSIPLTTAEVAEQEAADAEAMVRYEALLKVRDAELSGNLQAQEVAAREYLALPGAEKRDDPQIAAFAQGMLTTTSVPPRLAANTVTRITHSAQINGYYCGPATGVMLVKGHATVTQTTMASKMGTTTAGTGWATGTTAPVPKGLNAYHPGRDFTGIAVASGGGTSTAKNTHRARLVQNIDSGRGLAGNVYIGTSGARPTGYPTGRQIFHWFAVRGYTQYAAYTGWADSAHQGVGISWNNTPKYNSHLSDGLMGMYGQRGYVW